MEEKDRMIVKWAQENVKTLDKLKVSLTVHHELAIQNYQRDALNIIYSSNIITLLYMFRLSSTHLQEDIVVHKQHMVPSLSIRVPSVLLICSYRENSSHSSCISTGHQDSYRE